MNNKTLKFGDPDRFLPEADMKKDDLNRRGRPGRLCAMRFLGIVLPLTVFTLSCGDVLWAGPPAGTGPVLQQDLFAVSFPSQTHGWACGRWGRILHTSDGGVTWSVQASGTDYTLTGISFLDEQTGWAVGDKGTILHTLDGGRTWNLQQSPVDLYLMAVCFVDRSNGWIAGERAHILHTQDGGQTWTVQFQGPDVILKGISFCDPEHGWAAGEYGYIYHTCDKGVRWEHQAGWLRVSEETGDVDAGTSLFAVRALSPSTAWVVGMEGYAAVTKDGGHTWLERTDKIPKAHLFGIWADLRGTVLLAGNGLLMASSDGGETFQAVSAEPPVIYGWLYGLSPKGEDGFAAVGRGGWIYLSDGAATSWRRAYPPQGR